MGFKGIFENKSSVFKTAIFFLLIFVSAILHYFLALSLLSIFTDNGIALLQNQDLSNQASVDNLKFIQLFSGLGLFITPTLIYSYLTNFDFQFNTITRQSIILVFAIMLSIFFPWMLKTIVKYTTNILTYQWEKVISLTSYTS